MNKKTAEYLGINTLTWVLAGLGFQAGKYVWDNVLEYKVYVFRQRHKQNKKVIRMK